MTRVLTLILVCLAVAASISAQTPGATAKSDRGRVVYAIHTEIPKYPYELRVRHIEGTGVFQLHIRADGAVSSVDTLQSTGNAILDQCARDAYLKWRYRPPGSATRVRIPLTFTMHLPR